MTIQEAINNVAIVVSNARMTAPEHDALRQSLQLITNVCREREESIGAGQELKKG